MRSSLSSSALAALALTLALGACDTATPPDYRIRVMENPSGHGLIAVPPECKSWHDEDLGAPDENGPWATFGCAEARNLAAQIENPNDLLEGQTLGKADPVVSAAAIARYQAGKTTPLIDPTAKAPSTVVKMEDARLGGAVTK